MCVKGGRGERDRDRDRDTQRDRNRRISAKPQKSTFFSEYRKTYALHLSFSYPKDIKDSNKKEVNLT